MLYALANKLLNEADLEKIKEEMKMTKLGEMLRADFIEEGRSKTQRIYSPVQPAGPVFGQGWKNRTGREGCYRSRIFRGIV